MMIEIQIDESGSTYSVFYKGGAKYGAFNIATNDRQNPTFLTQLRSPPNWIKTYRFKQAVQSALESFLANQIVGEYTGEKFEYDTDEFESGSDPNDWGPYYIGTK